MKLINLMSDKIDYLFRRGKNADERTYDFFIRTVTFLILALIILCYGSFVHADSNVVGGSVGTGNIVEVTTLDNAITEYNDTYGSNVYNPLLGSHLYYTYPDRPYMSESFLLSYAFPTSVSGRVYLGAANAWVNVEADSDSYYMLVVPCNRSFYIEGSGNYDFSTSDTKCSFEIFFVDKVNQYIEQRSVNGCYIRNFDTTKTYTACPTVAVSYDTSNNSYTYGVVDSSKSGNGIDLGSIVYTNAPVFSKGSNITSSQFSNTNYDSIINTESGNDYFTQNNPLILNGTFNNDGSSNINTPEVESNKNHMAFDNVQIGISSLQDGQNLDSASVIVGCSVDDWINNNIDYYSVKVTYTIGGKFRSLSPWTFDYYEVMPLKTFTNNVYIKSMHDIFVGMGYYNSNTYQGVNESYIVDSDLSYNGGFPSLLNKTGNLIVKSIGTYRANKKDDNVQLILDDYYLNVDVVLIASDVQEPSGNFSKKFDFIRGNESIINSDGLQNSDPWTGEEIPQVDPYVPDVGNSTGGGYQINNNNQTVNINLDNRFQNIVSGGANSDDYDDTIDNIKSLFGTFKESLAVMGDSTLDQNNQPNGFVGLLQSSYSFIPGMPYYILGIVIIVALCVLLFIIKALVF